MKLIRLMEELQIVNEGLKFSNKEIRAVKKNARNILVAFEFEFTPVAEKLQAVRDGNRINVNDSPPPRRELSIDDVSDFAEYETARDTADQEVFDDESRSRLEQLETETKENYENNYYEELNQVDAVISQSDILDQTPYLEFIDIGLFEYDQLLNSLESGDDIDEEQITRFFLYTERIRNFIESYNEGLDNAIFQLPEDMSEWVEVIQTHTTYKSDESTFLKMLGNEEYFGLVQEQLGLMSALTIPKFPEFNQRLQKPILFSNYVDDARKIASDLINIDLNKDGIDNINEFLQVLRATRTTFNDKIAEAFDIYVENEVEEQADTIREEIWEYVHSNDLAEESIDLEGLMIAIQLNNWVIFMDDMDEPYFIPDDGSYQGSYSSDNSGIDARTLKSFMMEYGHKYGLDFKRDFHDKVDTEGHRMVEFKSLPVPLMDALKLMNNMFKFIDDVGDVSHGFAGLHTNMSIRGKTLGIDKFNKSKLMVLVDDELLTELFPIRQNIAKTLHRLNGLDVFYIASSHVQHNKDAFKGGIGVDYSLAFESFYSSNDKFQGINFRHMKTHKLDERRLEFRAIGGADYTSRERTITWWVYRFAYVMEAAFNDDFLQREYLSELINILDKPVKKNMKDLGAETFAELVHEVRLSGKTSYNAYKDYIKEDR